MVAIRQSLRSCRPEICYEVKFGGHTEQWKDDKGHYRVRWVPDNVVKGDAYDTPILGYRVGTSNLLRLWNAEAVESFDFAIYNQGDYYRAVEEKMSSENITKVLYPNDELIQGKILRLQQQFFFVSCSLQDLLRVHQARGGRPENFHEKNAIQLNDTHPAVAVPELMRLLVDEHELGWDTAWQVTSQAIAYTNHTCSQKLWKNGQSKFLLACYPATSRSSTRSIIAFSKKCGRSSLGMTTGLPECRLSMRAVRALYEWLTSPP